MPTQSEIKITKSSLYPFQDGKIVKSGTLYSLSDAAIVKNGVLYGVSGTSGISLMRAMERGQESGCIMVTVVKTDKDTGDAISCDVKIGIGNSSLAVSGFNNAENIILGYYDFSDTLKLSIENQGITGFRITGCYIAQDNTVTEPLEGFKGAYEPGKVIEWDLDLSGFCDARKQDNSVVIKIYIQNV